ADDAASEDDEAVRRLLLREQAGRVDAARRVEARDRRANRERAGGDDRLLEGDALAALDPDRVRVGEAADAFHPLDAVRLEERGDARGHLLDDGRLPRVRLREVELRTRDVDAELREVLLRLLERERGLHPGLRRDAADAEAGAAQLRLLLDAGDLRAELCGADRRRIPAGASSQNCNVDVHAVRLA